jgi:transposase
MESVTRIRVAWALRKQGVAVEEIGEEVSVHRATVYRWLKRIGGYGIEGYIQQYRAAKTGRRVCKTHPYQA